MGLRGQDPFVEQVRLATDILGVISPYLELHRSGKRWRGLCPFHTEKTPSFFVNQENQTYYCFGCHQGGDVFSFLMEQEKMSFPEALHALAERAGIPIPRKRAGGTGDVEDRIGEALDVAASFFQERLQAAEGAAARAYLSGRGITEEAIARFGLGWAPASWDALTRHAGRLLPERALRAAGLVIDGERGPYDRFRERVMVPIRTPGGRVIAFGGRLLGPGEPKYLNSPETPLYRKGTVLFGLPEARDAIRTAGDVLVVEGYFDVVSLSTAGIGWTVGTCGTAFTAEQAALLRRYADRWTLLFDGDRAGQAAVRRALDSALSVHPGVRVALCPPEMDPDDWVRRSGAEAVREGLKTAMTPLQYLEEWARTAGLPEEILLQQVAALLRRVEDPMVRDRWVQEAAGRFRLHEGRILQAIARPAIGGAPQRAGGQAGGGGRSGPGPARAAEGGGLKPRERQVVAAAVRSPGHAAELIDASATVPDIGDLCREILSWIEARHGEGVVDEAGLLSRAVEDAAILKHLSFLHEETDLSTDVPRDLLRRLKVWGLQSRMRDLTDRIRRAEERGEALSGLLHEKQDLAVMLRDLEAIEDAKAPPEWNFP